MYGVNSTKAVSLREKIEVEVLQSDNINSIHASLIIVPHITALLPNQSFPLPDILSARKQELADQRFNYSKQIDILLGISLWTQIIKEPIERLNDELILQNSIFGWLVCGNINFPAQSVNSNVHTVQASEIVDEDERLDKLIVRFWELEQFSETSISTDHQKCEQNFVDHHYRDTDGRYVLQIPFNSTVNNLGSSREAALRRFYQLERRLQKNHDLREKYVEFMENYKSSGHMTLAIRPPFGAAYWIPHHSVSIKFRVVFDASCKTTTDLSLNEVQLVGSKQQGDLCHILYRFRCLQVVGVTDIEQMFRQVRVHPSHWDYQRIFWRKHPSDPLEEYWLTCVTQGTAAAPFMAVRAMVQCARDYAHEYPLAASAIMENFYMDDGLLGSDNEEKALELFHQVIACLERAGFKLKGWTFNKKEMYNKVNFCATQNEIGPIPEKSVLGMKWKPGLDELSIRIDTLPSEEINTKRQIISEIAKLYDPAGIVGPVIVLAKRIIQDIWRAGTKWDERVPTDILEEWQKVHKTFPQIMTIQIPRWLGCSMGSTNQIHGFCDASIAAYGGVLYLRTIKDDSSIQVEIIASKSRMSPIRAKTTIPRLELSAAELLSRLSAEYTTQGRIPIEGVYLWSDSLVALHWMRKPIHKLDTFVANRVSSITSRSGVGQWNYVPTKENPADILSRGATPKELLKNGIWFRGPDWLHTEMLVWPQELPELTEQIIDQIDAECKKTSESKTKAAISVLIARGTSVLDSRSTLRSALRITAYVLRFVMKLRKRASSSAPYITVPEEFSAYEFWIKEEQQRLFSSEYRALSTDKAIAKSSSIICLMPWMDSKGIMRVGGRIKNANISFSQKHPIILPYDSRLSRLLIEDTHRVTAHGATQLMMAVIRQQYWIPKLRRLIRMCIDGCVTCVRFRAKSTQQRMADLPNERVQPYRAFRQVAVDFAGPITMKEKISGRNNKYIKGYIAVFVCLSTRAVHLEVAHDLSTNTFIASLQRLIARRGPISKVWSDNAKNFVGAARRLSDLRDVLDIWSTDLAQQQIKDLGIDWHFITPYAPWQGGLWEAAVRSMKGHLNKVLGDRTMSYPDLCTLIARIEACLNSRPLSTLSDDPMDLAALTPGHFLIGEPLVNSYFQPVDHLADNRLDNLQLIQKFEQVFWKRWQNEYLNELQKRSKWQSTEKNLETGDLVILINNQLPPSIWQLGRVIKVHPGPDGLVRNATVKTANSQFERAARNMIALPKKDWKDCQ